MVKTSLILVALVVLSACSRQVPDSGAFAAQAQAERNAALEAQRFTPPAQVQTQVIPSSDLNAAGLGTSAIQAPLNNSGAPLSAVGAAPLPAANNPALSDEQSFDAVASRESIESDAQRRAQIAANRQNITPTAVPDRPADTGPNIVEYALSAPNRKGQEWYSRSIFAGQSRFQRNCAGYNSPDAAQRDFLGRGGPDRDPRGLDPDGDGFACGWDPAPFLLAQQG